MDLSILAHITAIIAISTFAVINRLNHSAKKVKNELSVHFRLPKNSLKINNLIILNNHAFTFQQLLH